MCGSAVWIKGQLVGIAFRLPGIKMVVRLVGVAGPI